MPVDYSKWDKLELSDDSDFESHPNVDKKSFIRAKQNQIHQQRAERKLHIETLKYERIINDGLLRRIDTLLVELKSKEGKAEDPDATLFQSLIASAGDPDEDLAPKPPAGVHSKENEQLRYSQMMGSLIDQVKKEVDENKPDDRFDAYIKGVESHKKKVASLQKELLAKLAELEKEEGSKITSDHIRDGFNSSFVAKGSDKGKAPAKKTETVEVLNPAALKKDSLQADGGQSSGFEADVEDGAVPEVGDDDDVDVSPLARKFSKISINDYSASFNFIMNNRSVLAEKETDGLLMLAFESQMKGEPGYAKQCVHQGLLLQYCRALGPDGVGLFFKRMSTPGHQAKKVFTDDVNSTYERIQTRSTELAIERAREGQVEQIQLQAVEPGTEIHIVVPAEGSADPAEQAARAIFDTFPPNFQKALETGSLERVNEVLGKMSVDEAEEVVGQLSESGMLDMRQGVIDSTTEEGQEQLKHIKETGKFLEAEDATEDTPKVAEVD